MIVLCMCLNITNGEKNDPRKQSVAKINKIESKLEDQLRDS